MANSMFNTGKDRKKLRVQLVTIISILQNKK